MVRKLIKTTIKMGTAIPTRYAFKGIVMHNGRKMRQRLGFRGSKVVEVAFIPLKAIKKRR